MKHTLLLLLFPFLMFTQTQISQDITGEFAGDNFGYDTTLSLTGNRLAVSGKFYDGINGEDSGYVKVYEIINNSFIQIGNDIVGEGAGDKFGHKVVLSSNGNRLAISAPNNSGENGVGSGHVRIYEFINNNWVQIGQDIDGEVAGDQSGYGMAFSKNGNIVSICSYRNSTIVNDGGQVRVFQFNGTNWIQLGSSFYGNQNSDYLGRYMELSYNGLIIAFSYKPFNSPGFVKVYEFTNNNWVQIGNELAGDAFNDNFGISLDLSNNGNILAIGANKNDNNGINSGQVKIFENNNNNWIQLGQNIYGDAEDDYFGVSLDLSDNGEILAVGASRNNGLNGTNFDSGQVKIFRIVNDVWTQIGSSIYGESQEDYFGYSVSLSGNANILAIGGFKNDNNGNDSGHVRIYNLSNLLALNNFVFSQFSLYPNPAKNQVNIQLQESIELKQVNIYNTLGQFISTSKDKVINTSHLSPGMYLIEIETNQSKTTKQLVIE
ncbi:T9SS type A sorting domain-containing protein [Formosa maritima]|uniref:T9SS type A sorting domain-containing protein n=1 Tax=Formosa maritima TaxID=2592046 RepID=A0A5D0G0E4_9FLAO|nr:T9SS type A sorting domain-containing protein [Formosa maritima]TYA52184.1 T9SS type A sorting domain-containing protein [Formosa maritima]